MLKSFSWNIKPDDIFKREPTNKNRFRDLKEILLFWKKNIFVNVKTCQWEVTHHLSPSICLHCCVCNSFWRQFWFAYINRCTKSCWYYDNLNLHAKVEQLCIMIMSPPPPTQKLHLESKYWTWWNLYLALVRSICEKTNSNITAELLEKSSNKKMYIIFDAQNSREISPVSVFNWNCRRTF